MRNKQLLSIVERAERSTLADEIQTALQVTKRSPTSRYGKHRGGAANEPQCALPLDLLASVRCPTTVLDDAFFATWSSKGFGPPSDTQLAALHGLGLTHEEYQWFLRFTGHPFDFVSKPTTTEFSRRRISPGNQRPAKPGWRSSKPGENLTHSALLQHLRGDQWRGTGAPWNPVVGPHGRAQTWYFVIDLDSGSDEVPLLERYTQAVTALGLPSLLFKSSASGGFNLYYLLDEPVDLFLLKSPRSRGLVDRLLNAHGITLKAGAFEFFPTTKLRGKARGNRLRIPFGKEFQLLSPISLSPYTSGGGLEDLKLVARGLPNGRIRVYTVSGLRAACPESLPQPCESGARLREKRKAGRESRPPTTDHRRERAEKLLREGLTGPNQLDSATKTLGFFLRRSGLRAKEVETTVIAWLEAHHNGQSETYNADPEQARQEVQLKINSIFAKYGEFWGSDRLPALSEFEVMQLLNATRDDSVFRDPKTGKKLKRFVLQRALFESLRFAKQHVMREARDGWRHSLAAVGGNMESAAEHFRYAAHSWWPDKTVSRFVVVYSATKRSTLKGMKGTSGSRYWRAIQATGLYKIARPADRSRNKAAEFVVDLDLAGEGAFTSLETALHTLLASDDLKKLYSEHYQRIITAAATAGSCIPARDPADQFLTPLIAALKMGTRRAA